MNNEVDQLDSNDHGGCLADSLPSVAPAALKAGEMRVISGEVVEPTVEEPNVGWATINYFRDGTWGIGAHESRRDAEDWALDRDKGMTLLVRIPVPPVPAK